jgi:hypothetical protein
MAARKQIDDRRIVALYKLYGAREGAGKRIAEVVGCSRNNVSHVLLRRGYRLYPGKDTSAWTL